MAVRALGAIGGKKVNAALARALENEKNEKVRETIAEALQ
jgi:HEAT repeat protein